MKKTKEKQFSQWMKGVVFGLGICGILFYGYYVPLAINLSNRSEFSTEWLIFIGLCLIPCYAVLYFGGKMAKSVGEGEIFTKENSASLKHISNLALVTSIFWTVVHLVFLYLGISQPVLFLLSIFVSFLGVIVVLAGQILSHFILLAFEIKEENEEFI
ncbi:MAG: DUF2975 domain-containing protein [Eubacteriales bacterium]